MNKRFIFRIVVLFVFLLFYFPLVNAVCSLGANPLSMDARAKPGQEVVAAWNFYNLYGDRITHISVSKIQGPDWEIRYEPALHEESYEVSGVIEKINENVGVEKSSVVLEIPENPPEGTAYVKHPKQEGYIPVKPVKIYITIPDDAELWQDYKFVFEAKGNCFTEPGAVIPALATQLELNIKTTTEFYEKPVTKKSKEEPEGEVIKEKEGLARITGAVTGVVTGVNLATGILAGTSFILIMAMLFLLVRIRKIQIKK